MIDIKNQIGLELISKEGTSDKAVQVMEPEFTVKQSGFKSFESVILLTMTLNTLSKRPPDDPRGSWMAMKNTAISDSEKKPALIASVKDTEDPDVVILTSVKLSECRRVRKTDENGKIEDVIEVELIIS